jgi:hypothetical protein
MAFTVIEVIRINWIGRKITWQGEPNQWTVVDVHDGGNSTLLVDVTYEQQQCVLQIPLTKEFNIIMEFETIG